MNREIWTHVRAVQRRSIERFLHRGRGSQWLPRAMARSYRADRRWRSATRSLAPTTVSAGTTQRFVTARWRSMCLVAMAVVTGAAALSWSRTPSYRAEADVLVRSSILTISTAELPDMGSEKAVAKSDVVLAAAARALGIPEHQLASGRSVRVPVDTRILEIGYTSTHPAIAQQRAQALAVAYVANWKSRQTSLIGGTTAAKIASNVPATSIITPAALPSAPTSPKHLVDVGLAAVIGLALGFGTALLRDRLDDGLRSPGDLAVRVGAPLMAMLPAVRHQRGDTKSALVMTAAPESAAAGSYRELRTDVLGAARRRGAKTLLVTCPSNEGKTAVSANLAVAMTQAGYRVTFICADVRRSYADLLGAHDGGAGARLLNTHTDPSHSLRDTGIEGLRVLPSEALDNDHGTIVQMSMLKWVLGDLREDTDFVIIDGPPVLLGADASAIAEFVEMIVIVGDARRSTRVQVDAAAHRLAHMRANVIGCVLDNVGRRYRAPEALPPVPAEFNGTNTSRRANGVLVGVQSVAPVGGGEN
jgi:succinoglycan biosynthesis transport protein ExoP